MNTHHTTHRTLKPVRHTDLNKYYPHITLLIQLTILLTVHTLGMIKGIEQGKIDIYELI